MKKLYEDFKINKLHLIECIGEKDILVDNEFFIRVMKESKDRDLDNSNLFLRGFGRDISGNSVIKLTFPDEKVFSIQINNPGFKKTYSLRNENIKDLSDKDLNDIEKEVLVYIKSYGTSNQKSKLKTFIEKKTEIIL